MRRAILVTAEMREEAMFRASVREIQEAYRRGSERIAKRKIKDLMTRLLQCPSEQTVSFFLELQEQWSYWVDVYSFLETHWSDWATFEDRLNLIRHKFRRDPVAEELTNIIYSAFQEFENWECKLGLGYRIRVLVCTVFEKSPNNCRLSSELLGLLEWRYGRVTNVHARIDRVRSTIFQARKEEVRKNVQLARVAASRCEP